MIPQSFCSMILAWLSFLILLVHAKQDAICALTGGGVFPYTGYRLVRNYRLEQLKFPVRYYLTLSYCHRGKLQWEISNELGNKSVWEESFCHAQTVTAFNGWLGKVKGWFTSVDAQNTSSAKAKQCFKIARRKKYSRKDLSIYVPFAWVGGIYECSGNSSCANPIPVAPLIADDFTKYKIDLSKSSVRESSIWSININQQTPFLYTPTDKDLRFGLNGTLSPFGFDENTWHKYIKADENYTYTSEEEQMMSRAFNATRATMQSVLSKCEKAVPMEWSRNVLDQIKVRVKNKLLPDNIYKQWTKVAGLIWKDLDSSSRYVQAEVMDHMVNLRKVWDDVTIL